MRDSAGNLNGAHPSSHGDPSLHAWVAATSRQRLDKAVALLLEVLQPTNTQLLPITIAPGGSAVLHPVIPPDWPEAAEAAADAAAAEAEAAEAAAAVAPAAKPPPPPPPANAWASNRLLKQLPRQLSPVSSLQRSQGPTGSSNVSSDDEEGEERPPTAAAAVSSEEAPACPPPPPPPPPPRSAPQSPKQPAAASQDEPLVVPSTPEQPQLPRPPPHSLSPAQQPEEQEASPEQQQGQHAAGQQQMAVVFAQGLHSADSGSAGLVRLPARLECVCACGTACSFVLPMLPVLVCLCSSCSALLRWLHLLHWSEAPAPLHQHWPTHCSSLFLPCSPSHRPPPPSAPLWWPSSTLAQLTPWSVLPYPAAPAPPLLSPAVLVPAWVLRIAARHAWAPPSPVPPAWTPQPAVP